MNTHTIKVSINIGKAGVTEAIIQEIKDQLRRRKVVKIKHSLKTDNKKLAHDLAKKTDSEMILQIGKTIVLKK